MTTASFWRLPVGARFEFGGRPYRKTDICMGEGENGDICVVMSDTEAKVADDAPLLHGPLQAFNWLDYLARRWYQNRPG